MINLKRVKASIQFNRFNKDAFIDTHLKWNILYSLLDIIGANFKDENKYIILNLRTSNGASNRGIAFYDNWKDIS